MQCLSAECSAIELRGKHAWHAQHGWPQCRRDRICRWNCGHTGTRVLADRVGRAKIYMGGAAFMFVFTFPPVSYARPKECFLGCGLGFGTMAGAQDAFLATLVPPQTGSLALLSHGSAME